MKPRFSNKPTNALTRVEVAVVIDVLVIVAVALILPALAKAKRRTNKIGCVSCLKQIGLSFRLWEGDHGDKYPMAVSATNGGAMELVATGNAAACFRVMSNELSTPRILVCPVDAHRVWATNFSTDFNNSHISYFVGLDVTNETNPQMILDGDDNFATGGVPVKSGIINLWTNSSIMWTKDRHHSAGNIGMADGSVQQSPTDGLQQALQQTGVATNRLAVP